MKNLTSLFYTIPFVFTMIAYAENLVQNPSFEERMTHWHFDNGTAKATGVLYDQDAHSGKTCFKITNPSPFAPHVFGSLIQNIEGMRPDTDYTFSFYIKSANPGFIWYGGGNGWRHRATVKLQNAEWTRVSATFKIAKEDLPFTFRINTDDVTEQCLIDDVQIEEGSQTTPFVWTPPLEPGQGRFTFKPFVKAENLLSNPSFETLSAVRPQDWIWDKRNTDSTFEIIEGDAPYGKNAVRFTNKTGFGPHVYGWFGHLGDVPVKPSTLYSISMKVRTADDNAAWFGGGKDWRHRKMIRATNNEWKRQTYVFQTSADETSFPFMVVVENVAKQIDIDDIVFIEGEQPNIEWKHDAPTHSVQFTPVPPKRVTNGNHSAIPYWDPAKYPPAEWLFTDGPLDFEGFIGMTKPEENAVLKLSAIDENASVLATCTQPLPQDGNFAWGAKLKLNLRDSSSKLLTLKSVLSIDGNDVLSESRAIHLVTPQRIEGRVAQLNEKLDAYNAKIAAIENLPSPSKLRLAAILAKRFIGYIPSDIAAKKLNRAWFTLDKVDEMLTDAAREADAIVAKVRPMPPVIPQYVTSPITIDKSSFVATVKQPDGSLKQQPVLFTGYGHFNQVRDDLEIFPDYGVNVIQIEHGPSGTLVAEDKVDMTALNGLLKVCERAEKSNVAICLLLSPHYFPSWAKQKYPELSKCTGGFFGYCVHAPEARAVIEKYLRIVIPLIKDRKAIHSVCLSNEPLSLDGENCPILKTQWPAWLKAKYHDIATLNATFKTEYKDFADIAVPATLYYTQNATPLIYDFIRFNQETFADFHKWMADVIHEMAPTMPVHAKIMMGPFFHYNAAGLWSVDPQLFSELSDINGNDHYCGPSGSTLWYSEWVNMFMGLDFQRSMKDVPVFDTETHLIQDRNFNDIWPQHTYMAHIQAAVHGQGGSTMWVWERTNSPTSDFAGSVLHRPRHALAVSEAAMDLMRLAPEVTALQQRKPQIAFVYSPASVLFGKNHARAMSQIWQCLEFLDQPSAFLTERTLERIANGENLPEHLSSIKLILLPNVSHLPELALKGLEKLRHNGINLIWIGGMPSANEHCQPLSVSISTDIVTPPLPEGNQERLDFIQQTLANQKLVSPVLALDYDGKPAFGVQIRSVEYDGGTLVNLCNQTRRPVIVNLTRNGELVSSTDLLSLTAQPAIMVLPPVHPFILKIK
jgi:hypothetical protein